MNWINLHRTTLDSEAFLGAEPVERATWICLLSYCCGQENGGRIVDAAAWTDRQWQQIVRVTLEEARRPCGLWHWDGRDLIVASYPADKEDEVRQRRETARCNGLRGGRPGGAMTTEDAVREPAPRRRRGVNILPDAAQRTAADFSADRGAAVQGNTMHPVDPASPSAAAGPEPASPFLSRKPTLVFSAKAEGERERKEKERERVSACAAPPHAAAAALPVSEDSCRYPDAATTFTVDGNISPDAFMDNELRRPILSEALHAGDCLGIRAEAAEYWWLKREASGWMKATASGGIMPIGENWRADLQTSRHWVEEDLARARALAASQKRREEQERKEAGKAPSSAKFAAPGVDRGLDRYGFAPSQAAGSRRAELVEATRAVARSTGSAVVPRPSPHRNGYGEVITLPRL